MLMRFVFAIIVLNIFMHQVQLNLAIKLIKMIIQTAMYGLNAAPIVVLSLYASVNYVFTVLSFLLQSEASHLR
ncbi:hypothetical protein BDF20DRAFT_860687 [Mycotypha africana]|uniref:uncharacterized protein n=1 Tax=Mycotypha africana TaxID=64632 RepID=UPI002300175B|nr:uncharacterized protein BDF20DRAFT_860687 [Mycotypha africana]KAI8984584.1 hypothetical protein BDF20DRAFT_860687 [Mycotypha africana]